MPASDVTRRRELGSLWLLGTAMPFGAPARLRFAVVRCARSVSVNGVRGRGRPLSTAWYRTRNSNIVWRGTASATNCTSPKVRRAATCVFEDAEPRTSRPPPAVALRSFIRRPRTPRVPPHRTGVESECAPRPPGVCVLEALVARAFTRQDTLSRRFRRADLCALRDVRRRASLTGRTAHTTSSDGRPDRDEDVPERRPMSVQPRLPIRATTLPVRMPVVPSQHTAGLGTVSGSATSTGERRMRSRLVSAAEGIVARDPSLHNRPAIGGAFSRVVAARRPELLSPSVVRNLQRCSGNRAVASLLSAGQSRHRPVIQRCCSTGTPCGPCAEEAAATEEHGPPEPAGAKPQGEPLEHEQITTTTAQRYALPT